MRFDLADLPRRLFVILAEAMEQLEREILADLGIDDPYAED